MESETPIKRTAAKGEDRKPHRLTVKQTNFCRGIAKGLTYTEAYRQAYDCERMKESTIGASACRLAAQPHIIARLLDLEKTEERSAVHSAVWRRSFVLEGLAKEAVEGDTASSRVRALELLGKSQGVDLFTDIKEHRVTTRTSDEIESELRERIGQLFNGQQVPNQGELIDVTPDPWDDDAGPTDP